MLILVISAAYFLLPRASYIPLPKSDHVRGAENAPVTITEFSDFECPFCSAVNFVLDQLMTKYYGKIKIVYKQYPLPSHTEALKAAEASECASDQRKFWEYHDKLFANQQNQYRSDLIRFAGDLGLDVKNFTACLDSGAMQSRIKEDTNEGQSLGVRGTPTFFINSRMISGNRPIADFSSLIDQELARK